MISQNIRRRFLSNGKEKQLTIDPISTTVTAAGSSNITFTVYLDGKIPNTSDPITITYSGIVQSSPSFNRTTGVVTVSVGTNEDENNTKTGYCYIVYKSQQITFTINQDSDYVCDIEINSCNYNNIALNLPNNASYTWEIPLTGNANTIPHFIIPREQYSWAGSVTLNYNKVYESGKRDYNIVETTNDLFWQDLDYQGHFNKQSDTIRALGFSSLYFRYYVRLQWGYETSVLYNPKYLSDEGEWKDIYGGIYFGTWKQAFYKNYWGYGSDSDRITTNSTVQFKYPGGTDCRIYGYWNNGNASELNVSGTISHEKVGDADYLTLTFT